DDAGTIFADGAGWFVTIPRGAEGLLVPLREIEKRIRLNRSAAVARRLNPPARRAVAIRNGNVFDSEKGVVRPRPTVIIEGERITAVGPAESTRIPADATVIDATNKTVIPG